MSAYVEIACDIKSESELLEALELMGYSKDMLIMGRRQLEGYHGDLRPEQADVTIPRQLGSASNDIGFERNADGSWAMHVSDHDKTAGFSARHVGGFESTFKQAHAGVAVKKRLKKQGYKWTEEKVDGKTVIKATRWKK